jgi:hypothetical protein
MISRPKKPQPSNSQAARLLWEFHFRRHQTMIAAVINVDLDPKISSGNFVALLCHHPEVAGCDLQTRQGLLSASPLRSPSSCRITSADGFTVILISLGLFTF